MNLKVLSIRQPWADLILSGVKDVENRTWPTNHRGLVIIHAPKLIDTLASADLGISRHSLVTSAIIGAATLTKCTRIVLSKWHEEGCYGFYLSNPLKFITPFPCRGRLGFFNLEEVLDTQQTRLVLAAIEDAKAQIGRVDAD